MAAIELRFKGKSLTKTFKEQLAEKWAEKIESEDGIDTFINDREDVILAASHEGDRRATAASAKAKQDAAEAINGKQQDQTQQQDQATPEGMPEWMKPFMTQFQDLAKTVNGMQQARTAETLQQRFEKDERLKGIPAPLLHGRYPTKEEDFEAAVAATQEALKPFVDKLATVDFGKDTPGSFGGGVPAPGGKAKEASEKELDALMANIPI